MTIFQYTCPKCDQLAGKSHRCGTPEGQYRHPKGRRPSNRPNIKLARLVVTGSVLSMGCEIRRPLMTYVNVRLRNENRL